MDIEDIVMSCQLLDTLIDVVSDKCIDILYVSILCECLFWLSGGCKIVRDMADINTIFYYGIVHIYINKNIQIN